MLNQERWKEIEGLELHQGNGADLKSACVMQMVSYVAGEKWTDHPECACPILTQYAIRMNDRFNDEHRQRLKPLIPLLVDTKANAATQIARKRLIRWRNVTVTYPLILETLKLDEIAAKLRTFENNLESMAEAAKFLESKRTEIKKTYGAYANVYAYANAYAYAYANVYAYANAYAYAYANVYADADAYANAYADADANAWREKIATVAIETLKLAISVKVEA